MNYNKFTFTKEQFLEVAEFDDVKNAPIGIPFLLTKVHKRQKEIILDMVEHLGADKFNELIKDSLFEGEYAFKDLIEEKPRKLTVEFWYKYRGKKTQVDHIQNQGGHLIPS